MMGVDPAVWLSVGSAVAVIVFLGSLMTWSDLETRRHIRRMDERVLLFAVTSRRQLREDRNETRALLERMDREHHDTQALIRMLLERTDRNGHQRA